MAFQGEGNAGSSQAVSQFVIPAKSRETGREPGSRNLRDDLIPWIPDLAMLRAARPE